MRLMTLFAVTKRGYLLQSEASGGKASWIAFLKASTSCQSEEEVKMDSIVCKWVQTGLQNS